VAIPTSSEDIVSPFDPRLPAPVQTTPRSRGIPVPATRHLCTKKNTHQKERPATILQNTTSENRSAALRRCYDAIRTQKKPPTRPSNSPTRTSYSRIANTTTWPPFPRAAQNPLIARMGQRPLYQIYPEHMPEHIGTASLIQQTASTSPSPPYTHEHHTGKITTPIKHTKPITPGPAGQRKKKKNIPPRFPDGPAARYTGAAKVLGVARKTVLHKFPALANTKKSLTPHRRPNVHNRPPQMNTMPYPGRTRSAWTVFDTPTTGRKAQWLTQFGWTSQVIRAPRSAPFPPRPDAHRRCGRRPVVVGKAVPVPASRVRRFYGRRASA